MTRYSLSHLSDEALLRDLAAAVARDRGATAELLAHIAEVDERKLYRPAAYPSMYTYCVGELHLSEEAAFKRIHAARVARRFPEIFEAVAEGRLHLSAVVLLAPHLTEDTVADLLTAATHKSKSEIERLLAERFPRPDVLAWVAAIPAPTAPLSAARLAPAQVGDGLQLATEEVGGELQHAPGRVGEPLTPRHAGDRPRVTPLAPERFALQVTIGQGTHDKLRYAQALLGHAVPSTDLAAVLDRALDQLIETLERQKFAACSRSAPRRHAESSAGRYIPAEVRRAVWHRDGGQCTFTSETGRRCEASTGLEFDHVLELARGGEATVDGIRLRCRAHNQYEASARSGPSSCATSGSRRPRQEGGEGYARSYIANVTQGPRPEAVIAPRGCGIIRLPGGLRGRGPARGSRPCGRSAPGTSPPPASAARAVRRSR